MGQPKWVNGVTGDFCKVLQKSRMVPKKGRDIPRRDPKGLCMVSLVDTSTSAAVSNMPGIPCENKSDFFKERRSLKFDGTINILKSPPNVLLLKAQLSFFFSSLFFPVNASNGALAWPK